MSRSQGAANGGWPRQRPAAGEPDPRTGGRPAQRPQAARRRPQYAQPGPAAGRAPAYPQQGYGEQQPQAPAYNGQQAYHYPQQPQYAPPQAPAPAAPPANRQGLSSLDSARNAQPTHDFDNPAHAAAGLRAAGAPGPATAASADRTPQTAPPADAIRSRPPAAIARCRPRRAPVRSARAQHDPAAGFGAAPSYDQWPARAQPSPDPYGHDLGAYLPSDAPFPANSNQPHADPLQQADWAMPAAAYGDPAARSAGLWPRPARLRPAARQRARADLQPGRSPAYEAEEPRRGSWTMRIAGAVVVAIGLGYGLAQAYKAVLGGPAPDGATPVVSSDATPAKEKPLDPGGKQFAHTDSKVLGRLGDGGCCRPEEHAGGLSESDTRSNGSRKVTTLVVGRDGSIAPPALRPSRRRGPRARRQRLGSRPHRRRRFRQRRPGTAAARRTGRSRRASSRPRPSRRSSTRRPRPRVNVKSTKVIPRVHGQHSRRGAASACRAEEAEGRRCRAYHHR